jgi:dipeptidyl aminopeptidase/acylaminoacyl peptidase
LAIIALFQRRLIYHPERADSLVANANEFAPHAVENIAVRTEDGLDLHGWLVQSHAIPQGTPDSERRLVLFFHGNAGHRGDRQMDFRETADAGFDMLMVDYRGYGENSGNPSEFWMARDARAVWRFATEARSYAPERILICGESLGGAVAVRLCADLCEDGITPGGLVTISTFASLASVAAGHYPMFPVRYLLWDRYDSAAAIGDVRCPVCLIHGTEDDIVPIAEGRTLFEAAPATSAGGVSKQWRRESGMGHNDVPARIVAEVYREMFAE